jgi:hypothetical protein
MANHRSAFVQLQLALINRVAEATVLTNADFFIV